MKWVKIDGVLYNAATWSEVRYSQIGQLRILRGSGHDTIEVAGPQALALWRILHNPDALMGSGNLLDLDAATTDPAG